MRTLAETEAAVETLPSPAQEELFAFLAARLGRGRTPQLSEPRKPVVSGHSVLDIVPVHVGRVLRPLSPDDDLLGEMLEGRL